MDCLNIGLCLQRELSSCIREKNYGKNSFWFLENAVLFVFYIISAIWMVLGMCIVQRSSCSHF